MIVYGSVVSPFVRKVLVVAAEKGIAVENRPGGMGSGGDEFVAASPFGKIPAMRLVGGAADGSDFVLADSSAIVNWMDAAYPEPRLIPDEARARGETIWLDEFADTILMGAGGPIFFNRVVKPLFLKQEPDHGAADAAEAGPLPRALAWLDARLLGRNFLVGDGLTLADISCAVMFNNLKHATKLVDAAVYPELARWLAGINARPSLAEPNGWMDKTLEKARG